MLPLQRLDTWLLFQRFEDRMRESSLSVPSTAFARSGLPKTSVEQQQQQSVCVLQAVLALRFHTAFNFRLPLWLYFVAAAS